MSNKTQNHESTTLKTSLTYEDKVIKKIIGNALETIDGLLDISGGFFSDLKKKAVNTDDVTEGVNVEVGQKEVAVDLDIVVEYQKDIPKMAEAIQNLVTKDVEKMTHLTVVEININVIDIKTKKEHETDSITVQDRLEDAAQATSEFVTEKATEAKEAAKDASDKLGRKAEDIKEDIEEATEPRVK